MQEEKLQDLLRFTRRSNNWTPPAGSRPPATSNNSTPPLLPTPPPKPRFRQLSETELADRREKGLCFNCDERFSRTHRCKGRLLLLIEEEDSDIQLNNEDVAELSWEPPDSSSQPEPAQLAQLGLHAMSGPQTGRTMRLIGSIQQSPVHILVDGGSSLNFILTGIAQSLGLPSSPSPTYKVLVGNGAELVSSKVCLQVPIEIQGNTFTVDLHLLVLSGPDIVLGTPWLLDIGPYLMNYRNLTMAFSIGERSVILQGETTPIITPITLLEKRDLETDFREGRQSLTNRDGFRDGFLYFPQNMSCQALVTEMFKYPSQKFRHKNSVTKSLTKFFNCMFVTEFGMDFIPL